MQFNDFPILSETDYDLLAQQFKKIEPTSRTSYAEQVFIRLNECKTQYFGLNKNLNNIITSALKESISEIDKILAGLKLNFSCVEKSSVSVTDFNIFHVLKNLVSSAHILSKWKNTEDREYFKNIISQYHLTCLNQTESILDALANSDVHLFKHM